MSRNPDRTSAGITTDRPRSRRRGATALLALTAAVLTACQSIDPVPAAVRWRIEPVQRVTSAGETAAAYYSLGRYFQGQNRVQAALAAYRRAVAVDPRYAEAHNALGAMVGLQGQLDEAIRAFETALELTPSAPHILNNLGYALTLDGRYAQAIPLLQRAAGLDPANPRNRQNLALAIGLAERATGPILPNAIALVPATSAGDEPHDAGPEESTEAAAPVAATAGEHAASAAALAIADANVSGAGYRLEIANCMGVNGAAARIGERLAREGAPVARLKNQRPFNEVTTVIYYASGFEQEAQRLAARFGTVTVRVRQAQLASSDVRVVIGRDVVPLLAADRTPARSRRA